MNTYHINVNSSSFRLDTQRTRGHQNYERHVESLRRSIADLEAAGLNSSFYRKALAALEAQMKGAA